MPLSVLIADTAEVPGPDAGWRAISTPHREAKAPGKDLVTYWYKSSFFYDTDREPPWILLPKIRSGGKLFVNGIEVDRLQESTQDVQMRWRHPQLFFLPISSLRVGDNEIAIRMPTRELRTTFGGIRLGSEQAMRAMHVSLERWEHTSNDILSGATLCIGAFICVIWLYRRQDRALGLFGLSLLFWSLFTFLFRLTEIPLVVFSLWAGACYSALGGFFVTFILSLIRFHGVRSPCPRYILLGHWFGSTLLYFVGGDTVKASMDAIWMAGFLPMLAYSLVLTLRATIRHATMVNIGIILSFLILVFALLHDYAARNGLFNFPESYRLHMAIPGLLMTAGLILLGRFANSMSHSNRIKAQYANRIVEHDAAQDASYQRLRKSDNVRAIFNERQRLMREMHDGLGSHLLSTLVIAQRGSATQDELVEMLKECVDEMRLTIDSFSPDDPDLLSVLGNFRFRMESRFKALGIQLNWRNHDMPDQMAVRPEMRLQVLRILQEALTNVLKHAAAQKVEIDVMYKADSMLIRVRDDGVGIDSSLPSGGKGMANMQARAAKIGAIFAMKNMGSGTEISLQIPITAELHASLQT